MDATINLYETITERLIRKDRRGRERPLVYIVNIGPFYKIFTSESVAHRFLTRMGYIMNEDCKTYSHIYKSEEQNYIENHFKKC